MELQHIALAALDNAGIAAAFNRVYENYVVPFNVTAEWAARHIAMHDIDIERSPLWLDVHGAVVALSALGIRGTRGWVGGFGVAAAYRGQGIATELVREAQNTARRAGTDELWLEVISTNTAAICTYERAGFVHERELLVLSRPADARHVDVDTTIVQPAELETVLAARERSGARPPWQREPDTLRHLDGLEAAVVGDPETPLASTTVRHVASGINVSDVMAIDAMSAVAVATWLAATAPGQPLTILNEPEGSDMLPALFDAGWNEVLRQYEMVYRFT